MLNHFHFGAIRFAIVALQNLIMDYRRAWHAGGTYFFTINLLKRKNNDLLVRHVADLKQAILKVKKSHPVNSTFHKIVEQGVYAQDWGGGMDGCLGYED